MTAMSKQGSRASRLKRLGFNVIAVTSAVVLIASAVASILRRPGVVLYARSANPGESMFLVSEGSSLRFVRQQIVSKTDAVIVNARTYGAYGAVATNPSKPVEILIGGRIKQTMIGMDLKFAPAPLPIGALGVGWSRSSTDDPMHVLPFTAVTTTFGVSYWTILAISAVVSGLALTRLLRARRRSQRIERGQCPDCGYDLRATPDRCPECGRPGRLVMTMLHLRAIERRLRRRLLTAIQASAVPG